MANPNPNPPQPVVSGITPTSGPVGTTVRISGVGFGSQRGTVDFQGILATITSWNNVNIVCIVPVGATAGLTVTTQGGNDSSATFTVTGSPGSPSITLLTPASGGIGTQVTITGLNFGAMQGLSTVKFNNGVVASVTSWSASSIVVTVPPTATTGNVIVTVAGVASNGSPFTITTPSNGGTSIPLNLALFPAQNFITPVVYMLDPTNFNDPNNGSFYNWKVEDVIAGRTPTIRRVILSYRDLGPATVFVSLSGTNDAAQAVTVSQTVLIGNAAPLGIILTQLVGLSLTAQNLQLSVVRQPGGGPVSITKVRLEGSVESTTY